MSEANTASGNATGYFDWHQEPPFWNDYIRWFTPGGALLDVGCGLGWIADHVDNYAGIDSSQSAVLRARKKTVM